MKLEVYRAIISYYETLSKRDCISDLMQKFPGVSKNTMESIIAQEFQRKIQRSYWMHQNAKKVYQYYTSYQEAVSSSNELGVMVRLADEADHSPALFARMLLDYHFKERHPNLNKNELKEIVDEHYKNPMLIEDARLSAEIFECISQDIGYGPIAEAIKRCTGEEYEENLRKQLTDLGVCFSQEPLLRDSGFDKTPDVRLEVPIAIGNRIVNWIESKASFGDVERHKEYLVDQYARYKIRFGPGLVIYWFGFIDELNLYKRKNLFIMDHMPTDIKFMDPLRCIKMKGIPRDPVDGKLSDPEIENANEKTSSNDENKVSLQLEGNVNALLHKSKDSDTVRKSYKES